MYWMRPGKKREERPAIVNYVVSRVSASYFEKALLQKSQSVRLSRPLQHENTHSVSQHMLACTHTFTLMNTHRECLHFSSLSLALPFCLFLSD